VSVHALVSTFFSLLWAVTTAVVVAMGVTARMVLASIVLVYSSSMSIVSAVVLLVTPVVTTKVLLVMSSPSRLLSDLVNDSVAVSVISPLDPIAGAIELMRELVLTGCGG
jgi:ABC-type molybdate transport system permease subunit